MRPVTQPNDVAPASEINTAAFVSAPATHVLVSADLLTRVLLDMSRSDHVRFIGVWLASVSFRHQELIKTIFNQIERAERRPMAGSK